MLKKSFFILVALAVLLSACATKLLGAPAPTLAPAYDLYSNGATSEQGAPPAAPSKGAGTGGTAGSNSDIAIAQERLIVQNVDMTIVVADVKNKMDEINQMAAALGGYLVAMKVNQIDMGEGDFASQGSISIRVPAVKLDEALTKIKANTVDVPTENRTGQDVTSQYVDLQSQLTNLQRAEKDLVDIMDEAKNNPGNDATTKTQDVLNVYNQIVSIRGQIEQIQGQMKYIEETTSTSSINVNLVAEETVKPIVTGRWKPLVVASESAQKLVKFLQGFVNFLIQFVVLVLPVLIVILGPIALILWAIVAMIKRRRMRKAKTA
jgi:hypothetical protein